MNASACNPPADSDAECWVLLDDCNASAADPRSRLYHDYLGALRCSQAEELASLLTAVQLRLQQSQYAVALIDYELGARLHGIAPRPANAPLAQFFFFGGCQRLSNAEVDMWLAQRAAADQGHAQSAAGIAALRAGIEPAAFHQTIETIRAYIAAGDTYQTNFTYQLHFDSYGAPATLYQRLRARQPVPYGALIGLPDGRALLSLSPELFVRHQAGALLAEPMKGTAAASDDAESNRCRAAALAADPKNRAENLMIVDLLRNDLGRIAQSGSVTVPRLFDVARYGDLLQMTSRVQARLATGVTLIDIVQALFPCGSITGAPKRRTMQIIAELEPAPRGIYTGAIGWFDPVDDHVAQASALGDFCLSVPIRTLTLSAPRADGLRAGQLGIGAGIVHDSDAQQEYAECQMKAGFLTGLAPQFALFETLHASRAGCRHSARHLQRLRNSVDYFGFRCDIDAIQIHLQNVCSELPLEVEFRLKLTLKYDGEFTVDVAALTAVATPVRVLLCTQPVSDTDVFLRHKTTLRGRYDLALAEAQRQHAFDMLFMNTRGELTEGARSNLFIKLDGKWRTPPLSAGVLPGVMRAVLLDDPAWNAIEATLTLDDLKRAAQVVVCNALRGALPVQLDCLRNQIAMERI